MPRVSTSTVSQSTKMRAHGRMCAAAPAHGTADSARGCTRRRRSRPGTALASAEAVMSALIADDDRATTATLVAALRSWNIDTTVAHDGAAAWETLQAG